MKRLVIIISLFSVICAFAQNVTKKDFDKEVDSLNNRINSLQSENGKLRKEIDKLNSKFSSSILMMDTLQSQIEINKITIDKANKELNKKISTTESNANQKISAVDQLLSKNTLYGIIGVLFAIIFSITLYWMIGKRRKSDKDNIERKIEDTKITLQNESARLDTKLAELLETQLKIIQEERAISTKSKFEESSQIDHSLPLKVADEITRINAYANTLDPNSQDSKALKSSVKRLTNTFKAANYEIVDLLGQKYNDGLKVIVVNAVTDDTLPSGEEIITRIIKPIVKYKGEQIQAAQVDISIGPQTN